MNHAMTRRQFVRASAIGTGLASLSCPSFSYGNAAVANSQGRNLPATIRKDSTLSCIVEFAERLIAQARDDYGAKKSPLFVTQLNVTTGRIPAGTPADPGVWLEDPEVAGVQPFCQNLLFDLGLMDLLGAVSTITGDPKFDQARRDYLNYTLDHCRDSRSGYIPWGEHVGFDVVRDKVHQGAWKGWHEVKSRNIPWEQLWEVNPSATRHEIEVALHNHLCSEETFIFNRHAPMNGQPNLGQSPCSLSSSGGLYFLAWCWLYKKTGEPKFRDWAARLNAHFYQKRSPTTGLFPTDEGRPHELWYAEAPEYACFLLQAATLLGKEGHEYREQAIAYLLAYDRYAYDADGPGYFDTINILTGRPIIRPSEHYPSIARPKHLTAWQYVANSNHLGSVLTGVAFGYAQTGDGRLLAMFERVLALMAIEDNIRKQTLLPSGDVAGVLHSLVAVANRSRNYGYLRKAGRLTDYILERNRTNGYFTPGLEKAQNYYCARGGSADLAASVASVIVSRHGRADLAVPIRDFIGGMRQ